MSSASLIYLLYGARRSVAGARRPDMLRRLALLAPALPRRAGVGAAGAGAARRCASPSRPARAISCSSSRRRARRSPPRNFLRYVDERRLDGTELLPRDAAAAPDGPDPGRHPTIRAGCSRRSRTSRPAQTGLSHVDGAISMARARARHARRPTSSSSSARIRPIDADPGDRPATISASPPSAASSRAWTWSAASSRRRPRRPKGRG